MILLFVSFFVRSLGREYNVVSIYRKHAEGMRVGAHRQLREARIRSRPALHVSPQLGEFRGAAKRHRDLPASHNRVHLKTGV